MGKTNNPSDILKLVKDGNLEGVRRHIKEGGAVYKQDKNGNNPLHIAVLKGNVEMIRLLLNLPENTVQEFNNTNRKGYQPIDLARKLGNREVVDTLLYPENANLTDKIQIALAQAVYVSRNKIRSSALVSDFKLIDKILAALVDGDLKNNQQLSSCIKDILSKQDPFPNLILLELKKEIEHLTSLPEAQDEKDRFELSSSYLSQKIKTQRGVNKVQDGDHFIKIAPKKPPMGIGPSSLAGDGGMAAGFVAVKRIRRPSFKKNADYRGKYLTPWMIKVMAGDSEDLVNEYVNDFGFEPKLRKSTLMLDTGDSLRETGKKPAIASKFILETRHNQESEQTVSEGYFSRMIKRAKELVRKPPQSSENLAENLVEYLFLAILLGHNDIKANNFLTKKSGEFYLIDWDVGHETFVVFRHYFNSLVKAIENGDFKLVRKILSFRELSEIGSVINNYKQEDTKKPDQRIIKFLDKDILDKDIVTTIDSIHSVMLSISSAIGVYNHKTRKFDVSEDTKFFEELLSKLSDKQILAAFKRITDHQFEGIEAITRDYAEIGQSKNHQEYKESIKKSLAKAKAAVEKQVKKSGKLPLAKIEEPIALLSFELANKKLSKSKISPDLIIKYLAGQYCLVDTVNKRIDGVFQLKGIIPKFASPENPKEIHQIAFDEAIEEIAEKPFSEDALQILAMAFPLFGNFEQKLEGVLCQPQILDWNEFQKSWDSYSDIIKNQVRNNISQAIDALKEFTTKASRDNVDQLKLLAQRAKESVSDFGRGDEEFSSKQEEKLREIERNLQKNDKRKSPLQKDDKISPSPIIRTTAARPLQGFEMKKTDLESGNFQYEFEFANSRENFCFVCGEDLRKDEAHKIALQKIRDAAQDVMQKHENRIYRIINNVLDSENNEHLNLLRRNLGQIDNDLESQKREILSFIITTAKSSRDSFRDNDVIKSLSEELQEDLIIISREMQKSNKHNRLFEPGDEKFGMRSASMKLDYLKEELTRSSRAR